MPFAQSNFFSYRGMKVRFLCIEDKLWFLARDVSAILNVNEQDSLGRLAISCKRRHLVRNDDGNLEAMFLVNKAGFYQMAMTSNLDETGPFFEWVVEEIFPRFRNEEPNKRAKPHVGKRDNWFLLPDGITTTETIARRYLLSGETVDQLLESKNVIEKDGKDWVLTKRIHGAGYAQSLEVYFTFRTGKIQHRKLIHWTKRGEILVEHLLESVGFIPFK
ncbi:BRO family protein [Shouchella shacheensis]|uniref:BRO family protein n=1 Tax=Shouchella shacheensis TaxID=1649580 RepID=UPI0007400BA2|nr:BRO family protein [Shouchella shacheensis]